MVDTPYAIELTGMVQRFPRPDGSGVGPDQGAHTAEVLAELAGVDREEPAPLRRRGTV